MPTAFRYLIALIPIAYLLGSIPFGLIVGLSRGIDIRKEGSGNIGATNVGRLLGGRCFALVFALDLLKGLLPVLGAGFLLQFRPGTSQGYLLWLAVGLATILGHMFSLFLRFKGGKGVATSIGVVLGIIPYFTLPGFVVVAVWGAIFWRRRMVSLASIGAAFAFPIAYLGMALTLGWKPFGEQLPLTVFAVIVGGLVVLRHRSNIARLLAGTEHRVGKPTGRATGDQHPAAG